MNSRKLLFTVATAFALLAAACGGTPSTNNTGNETGTLTVWLMNGSAPQSVIDGVNADFKAKHPNVTVNVEIQQWSDVTTKLDTAFAGSTPPDVMELGNTLVAKYAAAGALQDISSKKSSFQNSGTWLQSLTDSCTYQQKLYCVPYYAGSRAIIYRTDLFAGAGVQVPTSMDDLMTVGQKLMAKYGSDSRFSALYFPGKYWYAAAPFVWDFGGDIATQSGSKWQGAINSAQSQQGLTEVKNLVSALSRADKTGDEAKQDQTFAQGHVAMMIANGWEVGVITDPKSGDPSLLPKLGAFPIPSHNPGQTAPVFLGGSDLGISAKSQHQALAQEWVGLLGGDKFQTQMVTVGGVIPNSTTLTSKSSGLPAIFAAAAKTSRFTPNSPNWASVESANVLQDMLVSIFTGKSTIPAASSTAADKITQILNG
ncbi:MAG: extracellular solute-binding protein [Chloroflexi bacterium]|nr:MAG: extracellular solute-binding protein [Chloroflexota bacterium]